MWHDLTGQTFNNLYVIGPAKEKLSYAKERCWECVCLLCGKHKVFRTYDLLSARNLACGCQRRNHLEGLIIEDLEVLEEAPELEKHGGDTIWKCKCRKCGEIFYMSSHTITRKRYAKKCRYVHRKYHSLEEVRLGARYKQMISRCYDPRNNNYHNYGARGIYVCDEWLNDYRAFFKWAFSHGFKLELELDRYPNNNGPYAPWNCRWVTKKVNDNNTRRNHWVSFGKHSHTISEWTDKLRIPYTMVSRIIAALGDKMAGEVFAKILKCNTVSYTSRGATKTYREWADHFGIPYIKLARFFSEHELKDFVDYLEYYAHQLTLPVKERKPYGRLQ